MKEGIPIEIPCPIWGHNEQLSGARLPKPDARPLVPCPDLLEVRYQEALPGGPLFLTPVQGFWDVGLQLEVGK